MARELKMDDPRDGATMQGVEEVVVRRVVDRDPETAPVCEACGEPIVNGLTYLVTIAPSGPEVTPAQDYCDFDCLLGS